MGDMSDLERLEREAAECPRSHQAVIEALVAIARRLEPPVVDAERTVDADRGEGLIARLHRASVHPRAAPDAIRGPHDPWGLVGAAADALEAAVRDRDRWAWARDRATLALYEDGLIALVVTLDPEDLPAPLVALLDRGAVTAPAWIDRAIDAARSGPLAPEAR